MMILRVSRREYIKRSRSLLTASDRSWELTGPFHRYVSQRTPILSSTPVLKTLPKETNLHHIHNESDFQLPLHPANQLHEMLHKMHKNRRWTSADWFRVNNYFQSIIINWDPRWLSSYAGIDKGSPWNVTSPSDLTPKWPVYKNRLAYSNMLSYISTFVPLLLRELWVQVIESAVKAGNLFSGAHMLSIAEYQAVKDPELYFPPNGILTVTQPINWMDGAPCKCHKCKVEIGIQNGVSRAGDMVLVKADDSSFSFGYVKSSTFVDGKLSCDIVVPHSKFRNIDMRAHSVKVKVLAYAKPLMRNLMMIPLMAASPLCESLLMPQEENFLIGKDKLKRTYSISHEVNPVKKSVVAAGVETILDDSPRPKIQLVQGPPGTGKTHTIIHLILTMYDEWNRRQSKNCPEATDHLPKLLICAPSNGAIDVVAKLLMEKQKELTAATGGIPIRIVRLGQDDKVDPDVSHLTVGEQAEKQLTSEWNKDLLHKTQECVNIHKSTAKQILNHNAISDLLDDVKSLRKKLSFMERRSSHDSWMGGDAEEVVNKEFNSKKSAIISGAHIVLVTLNSSHDGSLRNAALGDLDDPINFSAAIVDEACQCSEPETLMPLLYTSINRLILVGDPAQLPATVLSSEAKRYGYDVSLFQRIHEYFLQTTESNPVHLLTEQYRMHPEICQFPSKLFYDGKLTTSAGVVRDSPLPPYIVFDLKDSLTTRPDGDKFSTSWTNILEGQFVLKLVKVINRIVDREKCNDLESIGILTPYQAQMEILRKEVNLHPLILGSWINMDIRTVDGFQGKEEDVVIYSCVRALQTGEESESIDSDMSDIEDVLPDKKDHVGFLRSRQRMNVALTRAKYSQIIVLNSNALSQSRAWSKLIEDSRDRGCYHLVQSSATMTLDQIEGLFLRQKRSSLEHSQSAANQLE